MSQRTGFTSADNAGQVRRFIDGEGSLMLERGCASGRRGRHRLAGASGAVRFAVLWSLWSFDGTPIQVLFAPEDDVAHRLVPLIENAQSSIRFMAFSFTHEEIGAAVLARAKAGVDVRGIFETRGSQTEYSELPMLCCVGLPVRQDGNPYTFHHKVFVIDDRMVITGSFNFSSGADESNDENALVIANGDIAAQYLQEFEHRWAEATEPDAADMNCKK